MTEFPHSQAGPARSRFPSAVITAITTDAIASVYFNDDLLFATSPGQVLDVQKYIQALLKKVSQESPGQIYMHPEEFKCVRTTAGELGLLIYQGMETYKDVSRVTTSHFVRPSAAAMTYAPQCQVVLRTVEIHEVVLQTVDTNEGPKTLATKREAL